MRLLDQTFKTGHQSALVNLFGSRGRGNTGTDLNTIPAAAIERIEILRDGASAQYGSDAIAGVLNIVLKSNVKELTANVNYGAYTARYRFDDKKLDGGNLNANLNYGLPLGQGGYVNLTLDYNQREHTQRASVPAPEGLARLQYGDPQVKNSSAYLNARLPLGKKVYGYAFGGTNFRSGNSYAWTRFPTATDTAGHAIPNPRNVAAIYPGGFDPIITSAVTDAQGAVGVRATLGGFDLDVSNTFGSNRFHYGLTNSLNATLGAGSPTSFDCGGFQLQQNVTNLDLSRRLGVLQGLNLAVGSEYRTEWYRIFAGPPDSYADYQPSSNLPRGAQGFPGFQPANALLASRSNVGVYADAELDVTKQFLLAATGRVEHYSDFGSNFAGKVATRYKLTNDFSVRGTLSSGFRAPSLAQINFNGTFTNVVNGTPVDIQLARGGSAITQAVGIPPLKQETSTSASLGVTGRLGGGFSFTADGYYIQVRNRIVLTGYFDNSIPQLTAPLAVLKVSQAQFFANAVTTSSLGLDFVLAHRATLGAGRLVSTLAANFNHLTLDQVNIPPTLAPQPDVFFGVREQAFVKASAPPYKINLTEDYTLGRFGALVRVVAFGQVILLDYSNNQMIYTPRQTVDAALSYALTNGLRLSVGSNNLFNRYPTFFDPQNTETGGAWDPVQMGSNGRFLFAKLQARF